MCTWNCAGVSEVQLLEIIPLWASTNDFDLVCLQEVLPSGQPSGWRKMGRNLMLINSGSCGAMGRRSCAIIVNSKFAGNLVEASVCAVAVLILKIGGYHLRAVSAHLDASNRRDRFLESIEELAHIVDLPFHGQMLEKSCWVWMRMRPWEVEFVRLVRLNDGKGKFSPTSWWLAAWG